MLVLLVGVTAFGERPSADAQAALAAPCYESVVSDVEGDAPEMDVVEFRLSYDCSQDQIWSLTIRTRDSWASEQLQGVGISLDGDANSETGCSGYESSVGVRVQADYTPYLYSQTCFEGLRACCPSNQLGRAFSRPSNPSNEITIQFSGGVQPRFRWTASIASSRTAPSYIVDGVDVAPVAEENWSPTGELGSTNAVAVVSASDTGHSRALDNERFVVGEVRNNGRSNATDIRLDITAYDERARVVRKAPAKVMADVLRPGETAAFVWDVRRVCPGGTAVAPGSCEAMSRYELGPVSARVTTLQPNRLFGAGAGPSQCAPGSGTAFCEREVTVRNDNLRHALFTRTAIVSRDASGRVTDVEYVDFGTLAPCETRTLAARVRAGRPASEVSAFALSHISPSAPPGSGYWMAARDGGVFTLGALNFCGSTGHLRLNQPIVDMAPAPTKNGYWLVASDGGIFTFGNAGFFGSTGGLRLNRPVIDMAPTPSGSGYWLVAADGGVFTFGDAGFHGSTGGIRLNRPIVDMVPTSTGAGYWLVAADGGLFTFGDAAFFGSLGDQTVTSQVVDMAPTPAGDGYWIVTADGTVFPFGSATRHPLTQGGLNGQPVVEIASSQTGNGYLMFSAGGRVAAFGDAGHRGDVQETLNASIVGAAFVP